MLKTREELIGMLDDLDAGMQDLIDKIPDTGDFWAAFALRADHIDDCADPEDEPYVHERIDAILASYGLDPAGWEAPDNPGAADAIEPTNNR